MYIERGEYENALNTVAKILKSSPDNIKALILQVYSMSKLQKKDKKDQIIKDIEKILKQSPNDLMSLINIAQLIENSSYSVIFCPFHKISLPLFH